MTTDSSPAEAFQALRREVALLRRALEGLAAEQKAQPDYSGVLAGIGQRIKEQNAALGAMAKAPTLQLTPEMMGQQIMRASEQVRAEDARLLGLAQNGMTSAVRQIEAALATARTAHAQQRAVRWYAILGIVIGLIAGAGCTAIMMEGTTHHDVAINNEGSAHNSLQTANGDTILKGQPSQNSVLKLSSLKIHAIQASTAKDKIRTTLQSLDAQPRLFHANQAFKSAIRSPPT
ncbi:hypothetical protein [Sphingosinicella soli]|uniref:Uncharacterized protein n=1 Tax=Sphingosinicella soli TaxID=333708 RepID=A0A7W7B4Q0_9SPHN|nr:hypothetical protein [Sphingosinicella soli]MBB4633973.1 hypothetical protein [Sphingosinicella soli]